MDKEPQYTIRVDRSHLSVGSLQEDGDEKAFWLAATPEKRWEAIELNRRLVYGYDPTTTGLQRVLEIAQLPRG